MFKIFKNIIKLIFHNPVTVCCPYCYEFNTKILKYDIKGNTHNIKIKCSKCGSIGNITSEWQKEE